MPVQTSPLPEGASFDYVIVGAGSAGCVIANRLSEDPSVRVCLLEAGPPDTHPLIRVPAAVAGLINHPRLDWRYRSVAQANAHGRMLAHPAGRMLGGSSSMNGMVYSRGHPSDYDGWAAQGNAGWSWAEVLPYFLRSEDNVRFRDSAWHGTDGPMQVSDVDPVNPLVALFLQAGRSLGLPVVEDFNGPHDEGVGRRQTTIREGRRESSATAFLRPAAGRANLVVCTGAQVQRVLLQERRATGVAYRCGGQLRRVLATREVIVSAGAYASPALLLRSGIGDTATLQQLGIHPELHLPGVGANLQDHVAAPTQFLTDSTLPYGASLRAWPALAAQVLRYVVHRRGLLASNVFEAAGFVRTEPHLTRPDIQLVFMPVHRDLAHRIPRRHGFGIQSVVLHPQSRGRVTLSSADPAAPPLIDPGFFSAPADLLTLTKGVRLARRLLGAPAFAALAAREILPGPGAQTDQELAVHIRANCATTFHPVGTCRMGADHEAVVDADLRVHGLRNLRVADASVMPCVPGGNTHAPTVMIGEKASDLIRGFAPLPALELPPRHGKQKHAEHLDPALGALPV